MKNTFRSFALLLSLLLASPPCAIPQTYTLAPVAKQQFFDVNGYPLAGGLIYSYAAGTSTPLVTYSNSAGTANANPIVLDSGGFANLWLGTSAYKLVAQNAAGVQQWSVDNILATGSALTTLTGANGASLINYTAGGGVSRTIAAKLTETVSATDYAGADIGAKVNAAWAACANACTVYVPAGTYSYSTTINYPVLNYGSAGLRMDLGAILTYTGSGYAISADGGPAGKNTVNLSIEGGNLIGTSAGLAGVYMNFFNKGRVANMSISGFSNGDGIRTNGSANTIDLISNDIYFNKNGFNNILGDAIHWFGGHFSGNTQWGVWEQGGGNDGYFGVTWDPNGCGGGLSNPASCVIASPATSGNMFIQQCNKCNVDGSYFEYAGVQTTMQVQITIGDTTLQPLGTTIIDNVFASASPIVSTIVDNGQSTIVIGNVEDGAPTQLVFGGPNGTRRYIGPNGGYYHATFGGTDADSETLLMDPVGTSSAINSFGPTPTGIGFTSVSGLNTDLVIRTRVGGTNAINFQNIGGGGIGTIDNSGNYTLPKIIPSTLQIGSGTAITSMVMYSVSVTPGSVGASQCIDAFPSVSGLVTADRITALQPPTGAYGNLSVWGFVSATSQLDLHICNPSTSPVTAPSGTYSFLAVH